MKALAYIFQHNRIEWTSEPFPGAWRGAGSSDFFGLFRVCGSTNERDQTAPRKRYTGWNSPPSDSSFVMLMLSS